MATMGAILEDIWQEVALRIYRIAKEVHPEANWKAYEPKNSDSNPIREMTGHPRLFGFDNWEHRRQTVGSNVRKYSLSADLVIGYPRGEEWRRAAITDADKISRDLNTNSTSVSGCDFREIGADGELPAEVTFEEAGEGDWQWMIMPFYAIIETNA